MEIQRRTFPTTVKTAPTEAELDRMLAEMVRDHFAANKAKAAPEPSVPTDAELRQRAAELGISVPHPDAFDAIRAEAYEAMVNVLRGGDR